MLLCRSRHCHRHYRGRNCCRVFVVSLVSWMDMLILLILKLWPTSAVGGGVSKSCQSYFLLIFLSSTSSIAAAVVVAAGEEKTHWFGLAYFFAFAKNMPTTTATAPIE